MNIAGEGIYLDLGVRERMGFRSDQKDKLKKDIKRLERLRKRDAAHAEDEAYLKITYTDPIKEIQKEINKLHDEQAQPVLKRGLVTMRRKISGAYHRHRLYAPTVPMQANQLRPGHRTWDFALTF